MRNAQTAFEKRGDAMRGLWKVLAVSVAVVTGLSFGLPTGRPEAQQKNLLVAKKTAAAPAVDGSLDAAWNAAQPLVVRAIGGKNLPGGSTEVSLRSVVAGDTT